MKYDVLIIGAGAAGLIAMDELVQAGYKVCLLEANHSAGGRIATLQQPGFTAPLEMGAEFIHGEAPITLDLLRKAKLECIPMAGEMISVRNGVWLDTVDFEKQFEEVAEKIDKLENDSTIREFLDKYFSASEHEEIRKSIQQFAEGFSLADIDRASILAFGDDWIHQSEGNYRIPGGYQQLINYLFQNCRQSGMPIHLSSPVYKIEHREGHVIAYTSHNQQYEASKLIITVSAGVLQAGDIKFFPALTDHAQAIAQLGYGSVLKVFFHFNESFWKKRSPDLGFLLSDEFIPTWWTQLPDDIPMLTGWLGGPQAIHANKLPGNELYESALSSLATIFGMEPNALRNQLTHHKIICWDTLPYIKGGYSYNTLQSADAKRILQVPVNNTIYFAGEAIYSGESQGTVEAALASGKQAAEAAVSNP